MSDIKKAKEVHGWIEMNKDMNGDEASMQKKRIRNYHLGN